jgi:hypothetical protein
MMNRLRSFATTWLATRVVWLAAHRIDLIGHVNDRFALVAVVGREHLELLHRRYPIRSRSDLLRVLRLEFDSAVGDEHLFWIGELRGDEREVIVFRVLPTCPTQAIRALFWVPETLVLQEEARERGVITICREGLRYFLASDGRSMIEGGVIHSASLFALAVGLPTSLDDGPDVGTDGILSRIPKSLTRMRLTDWWTLRSPVAAAKGLEFAKPAAVFAGFLLVIYFALVTTYLWGMESYRQAQLRSLGPEVTALIAQQRAVDIMTKERNAIATLLQAHSPAWPIWELVAVIWRARGTVYSINLVDNKITFRCSAPDATEVLGALQRVPGVEGVKFESGVRQVVAGQEFVISLSRLPGSSVVR